MIRKGLWVASHESPQGLCSISASWHQPLLDLCRQLCGRLLQEAGQLANLFEHTQADHLR